MPCSAAQKLWFALGLILASFPAVAGAELPNGCRSCHPYQVGDFSPLHPFAFTVCTSCHQGEVSASSLPEAHVGLIARPGTDLREGRNGCAGCHPGKTEQVGRSLMNTARGLVQKTREALGEGNHPQLAAGLHSLGDSPADSMLRKLCVSCHLSHPADRSESDVTLIRGGGCSACHINGRQQNRHPRLSAQVEDGRCFGCHSRSGRISLNYVGLAETEPDSPSGSAQSLWLSDGRAVRRVANDRHYQAGMSCIDCHTSSGLMGGGDNSGFKQKAVDIQCLDCHAGPRRRVKLGDLAQISPQLAGYLSTLGMPDRQVPLTRRHGTPLWHVEIRSDGSRLLYPKLGGAPLPIPDYRAAEHPNAEQHRRLACSACHSQWAPQCYGCHSQYQPDGRQWDHLLQQVTAGRWHETRWDVRADLPSLGVDGEGRIRPVTPGMIMQVEHPAWERPLFKRLFALSEPHTTGKARSCTSCHRSSQALALGEGGLAKQNGEWRFQAMKGRLQDGLPADAWTALDGALQGQATDGVSRPFSSEEILRILNVDIPQ